MKVSRGEGIPNGRIKLHKESVVRRNEKNDSMFESWKANEYVI